MMSEEADECVTIDADLYARVQRRVEDSEFEDVDTYVKFVLEELLRQLEGTGEATAEQDEEVRERLSELGYLE